MKTLIQTAKNVSQKVPVVRDVYAFFQEIYDRHRLSRKDPDEVFEEIYHRNTWHGQVSISGRGSDPDQTGVLVDRLSSLLKELDVSTMLDIPCGDFQWMSTVDLDDVDYVGADIVRDLVEKNREHYAGEDVRFEHLNLIEDPLPEVDLVFCRDCLVHFSFRDCFRALENICESGSTYLLTTTYPNRRPNEDIETGQWRPLNLSARPFGLPEPMVCFNEQCTEREGAYRDKSMGLWRIADIENSLPEDPELLLGEA